MAEPAEPALRITLRQDAPIPLDADLAVAAGELLALVGPSGSGKTTILRAIAGLHHSRAGQITCNGSVWFDAAAGVNFSPQRRRVGLVFQDYALFPHLSACHNVALALGHMPASRRRARAVELLDLVHLGGLEDRWPAALSGGQRQRVALARALAREPEVLLLDEPFSAVDQVTRRKLQRELAVLRRQVRVPILLVTHDLAEAAALADRISLLHHGRTLQNGPPGVVTSRPASPLVARLMDQPNVFQGRVTERHVDGRGLIAWNGDHLEVASLGAFQAGETVSWMIPASHIVLHRHDRPSRGERENPIRGTVGELVALGENTAVTLLVDGIGDRMLTFSVSTHAVRRNNIAAGVPIVVSLLADGIHLMPLDGTS
jgi:molybdate transport system ATP-binding protein